MSRSLQDVLRAGQARSRANAPRVLQTRLEREEEIREENRRIARARNLPEMGREIKHAATRLWEETGNEADFVRGARDCFAEREDLWRQVEGMEALRETSNVYKQMYEDLLERHEQIVGRLMYRQNQAKLKERIFMSNANEARVKGDMEAAEDFGVKVLQVLDEIQGYDYIMYGLDHLPPERPYQNEGEEVGKVGW